MSSDGFGDVPDVIEPGEPLNRRIKPVQYDDADDKILVSAFIPASVPHEISVDREQYRTTEASLAKYPGFGLAQISCSDAWRITELRPVHSKNDHNRAHALILINKQYAVESAEFVARCSQLAESSKLRVPPNFSVYRDARRSKRK